MASDFAIDAPRVRADQWIAEAAFVAFLLLVFIGLQPFAPRFPEVPVLNAAGGQGDFLRQASFLAVFSVIALCAVRKYGLQAIVLLPGFLSLMLGWCLLSAFWADEGAVTFRRAGLELIIVLSAVWGLETVGIERSLKLFRAVLICVLVVNWLSIALTARAIHQPGETDPGIVGNWRGLYFHKNIAGAVSALSVVVFAFFATDQRRRADWLLALAAAVFLVMTNSKSSMGLLVPSLVAWVAYRFGWRSDLTRSIAMVAALLFVILGAAAVAVGWDAILGLVSDPQEFTGRTAIWSAELAFASDHLGLGSGFGSFSDTGGISPLHNYVGGSWVEQISHGHNGYLQLLMETGIVGFALSLLALVVQPGWAFWRRDAIPLPFKAFLFAMFVFLVLHNIMESDFLQGDGPAWVALLLMLCWLRQARAITAAEDAT